jgi:siroheme synthase (precorrin-2 oxidase/ferrochelatase)
MAKYPIFLELGGRRAVVIGGGLVAIRKAQKHRVLKLNFFLSFFEIYCNYLVF